MYNEDNTSLHSIKERNFTKAQRKSTAFQHIGSEQVISRNKESKLWDMAVYHCARNFSAS